VSYPRKLQILVVEDDSDAIEAYKSTFSALRKTFPLVDPVFARSFSEAKRHIDAAVIFQIVILDLNLPIETRQDPAEGFKPGEQLLEELAKRDDFPIPVVLVISGKLNLRHSVRGIQDRLDNDFSYGRMVIKGNPEEQKEIEDGLVQALKYIDLGIHIRDSGRDAFPTLSPREEDLLRRCVLSQPSALGVDVRWWSTELGASFTPPSTNRGPTKVLMGHFLLDDGMEGSIPTFFKFEPAGNAPYVSRDVGILAQKLSHIKVFSALPSRTRSLLVTQSATNRGVPVSLNEYLRGDPAKVAPNIPKIISQVSEQLAQLGGEREDDVLVGTLLWECLDRSAIERVWLRDKTAQSECDSRTPMQVFDTLKVSEAKRWVMSRTCVHGDLNATNVAIDVTREDEPRAYIFDAAGMKADLESRDLATLEVTTVLFNSMGPDEQLVSLCHGFYSQEFLPIMSVAGLSPLTQNVFALISSIRSRFKTDQEKATYALLVFDAVMRQMSGLGIQPSPNKIAHPSHACCLAAWVANWLQQVAPAMLDFRVQNTTLA
jgi:CheY-like chemotaxis protein